MYLYGKKKRCVEQLARGKHLTCRHCGSSALVGREASWDFGGIMNVYLDCSNCDRENTLKLSLDEAMRCGFDPEANMQGTET